MKLIVRMKLKESGELIEEERVIVPQEVLELRLYFAQFKDGLKRRMMQDFVEFELVELKEEGDPEWS
jgi:hypothetical protein